MAMRKLKEYTPTRFMAPDSHYDKDRADYAVAFIECLCHTKGRWAGQPFDLIDWQEQIIRDIFGVIKPNGYRQFNTAYVEIPKKQGKSELAAAVALYRMIDVKKYVKIRYNYRKISICMAAMIIYCIMATQRNTILNIILFILAIGFNLIINKEMINAVMSKVRKKR